MSFMSSPTDLQDQAHRQTDMTTQGILFQETLPEESVEQALDNKHERF